MDGNRGDRRRATANRHRLDLRLALIGRAGPSPARPPPAPATSVIDLLRRLSILGIASMISGILVGGVGGRIVMAISRAAAQPEAIGRLTENGNRIGEFTVGGTIGLVVFVGLLGGVAASIVVVASEPFTRRAGLLRGPIMGAAVLATIGANTFESFDFRLLEPPSLNVAMFIGLFLLFGVVAIGTIRLLYGWLPAASERTMPLYLTVTALGALPLLLVTLNFTSRSFCGCDPWLAMGLIVLPTTVAAIGWQVLSMRDAPRWQRLTLEIVGSAGLIGILVLGLSRVIEDISRIL